VCDPVGTLVSVYVVTGALGHPGQAISVPSRKMSSPRLLGPFVHDKVTVLPLVVAERFAGAFGVPDVVIVVAEGGSVVVVVDGGSVVVVVDGGRVVVVVGGRVVVVVVVGGRVVVVVGGRVVVVVVGAVVDGTVVASVVEEPKSAV
jgi:hypothetical protein